MAKRATYLLFFVAITICNSVAIAQQAKIDSLLNLLKTAKEDTNKVEVLNNLSMEFRDNNPDTAIYFATKGLNLSQKLNFLKGESEAFLWKGTATLNLGKYEEALSYLKRALEFSTDKKISANIYSNIGLIYFLQSNYSKALDYYSISLKINEEIKNKSGIASDLGKIGSAYMRQGNYPKTISYYLKALKVDEEIGDKNGVAIWLSNIGGFYGAQGDYPKAFDYFIKTLKIAEEIGNKELQKNTLCNIGNVYEIQGNYPKALDYYFKSLKMAETANVKTGIAAALYNIGNLYIDEVDKIITLDNSLKKDSLTQKGLDYSFRALKIENEIGNKHGIAMNLTNIAWLYTHCKKYKEAEKYILDCIKIVKETGDLDIERLAEEDISDLYTKTNRPQLALEHYKKAMILKDTLFNQEKNKEITRKEMNYEFDKKEAVAEAVHKKELENQRTIADEKSRKQAIVTWSVGGGLMLVLVFAGFIFRSLRITRKQKQLIEIQKTEVEQQKQLVEEHQKEIIDSITYARRIQRSLLPSEKYIEKSLIRLKDKG